jgi:hypothetical protein
MEVRSIKLVIETLNRAGVRYIVVGGLAVNAHGYFRVTNDLDLAPFVSLPTLLAMKQQSHRPSDLLDIENLRKLHPHA